jgi:hypothetical protein
MEKKIYRIEIGEKKFWIGMAGQLMTSIDLAVLCTEDEHLMVMEKLNVPAVAYNDTLAWHNRQANDALPTDHSKVANKLVFNFHSDASHGWLAVKLTLVRELGLADQISEYSYMQGKTAYLEEDADATRFINAFKARFGFEPKIKDLDPKDRSPIRSFKRFKMEA